MCGAPQFIKCTFALKGRRLEHVIQELFPGLYSEVPFRCLRTSGPFGVPTQKLRSWTAVARVPQKLCHGMSDQRGKDPICYPRAVPTKLLRIPTVVPEICRIVFDVPGLNVTRCTAYVRLTLNHPSLRTKCPTKVRIPYGDWLYAFRTAGD